jgi:hypothetical protein
MVPALAQVGSDANGCTPVRKSSRMVSLKESKSRYSWNCGDLRQEYLEGPGFLVSLKRSATWAVAQAVRIMVLGQDCSGVLVLSSDNHTNGTWIGCWLACEWSIDSTG